MGDIVQLNRVQSFLVNYLGDRQKQWGIDSPVVSLFDNIKSEIRFLINAGFIVDNGKMYILTPSGEMVRQQFRDFEKQRKKRCKQAIYDFAFRGDFLSAYNTRALYEKESVIPHGISVPTGGDSNDPWAPVQELPNSVLNCIKLSKQLDFSDIQNSEHFKTALRNFYIGSIIGGARMEVPPDLEEQIGEELICPNLDKQLAEKCLFRNPPKLRIYLDTKIRILNFTETGLIKEWDGMFILGMYDCTDPFHAAMAEYEALKQLKIEGFPKTFQTFWKHKCKNSPKYQVWSSAN